MKEREQDTLLPYRIGGLLYTPVIRDGIIEIIQKHKYPFLTSLALYLEDSIRDEALDEAELQLKDVLTALCALRREGEPLPLLFVRIRSLQHLRHVHTLLGEAEQVLTGYILPKFDLSNEEDYAALMQTLRKTGGGQLHYMPILESRMIADAGTRLACLKTLRQLCERRKEQILNIRVGGVDLCGLYGLRREETQNIYDIGVIRAILADIINVFRPDYVVSGPVWEYFGANPAAPWAEGLRREAALDRLNGFIGKTAIHPSQLPLIYQSLQVRHRDYADAMRILKWDDGKLGVAKSCGQNRMNEMKCHIQWARQTAALAEIYGIREQAEPFPEIAGDR